MSSDVRSDRFRLNDEFPAAAGPAAGSDATPRTPARLPLHGVLARAPLQDGRTLSVRRATADDADAVVEVMHRAFRARPALGSAPAALADTAETVRASLGVRAAFLADVDGIPAATTLVAPDAGAAVRLGRVAVHPDFQRQGIATALMTVLLESLASCDVERVTLLVRREFPEIAAWWGRQGFVQDGQEGDCWVLARALPVVVVVPDAPAMRDLGRRLAALVVGGDLIIATGDLGAGKTTLTQGLGEGMEVTGPIISPTFVLSRIHPGPPGRPALVHVDAYRLGGAAELDDLDLDATCGEAVTLVEWGEGVAESLSADRLEIGIRRDLDPDDETRWVFLTPVGPRWQRATLAAAISRPEEQS